MLIEICINKSYFWFTWRVLQCVVGANLSVSRVNGSDCSTKMISIVLLETS